MHLFCLALLYHIRPELEVLTGTPASKIRDLLGQCLDNLKILQRTSILFRRAREAIHRFTQKLDSISKLFSMIKFRSRARCLTLHPASMRELPTPRTFASEVASPFSLDLAHYDLHMTNEFLGQPDLDQLGDGLYY